RGLKGYEIMRIKIKSPMTVANLGSGFDSIGVALNIYNETEFRITEGKKGKVMIEVSGYGKGELEDKKKNLLFKIFKKYVKRNFGYIEIKQKNLIPLRKGLGSSATAIIHGIIGAFLWNGKNFSMKEVAIEGAKIEGHPDNVFPSVFGGISIIIKDKGIEFIKFLKDYKLLIIAPEEELRTEFARRILPKKIPLNDAIFNIQRFGSLVYGLLTSEKNFIKIGTEDRIHERYRIKFIPGGKDIIKKLFELGSFGAGISGSGPSIFSFIDDERIKEEIERFLREKKLEVKTFIAKISKKGTEWRRL
ncbi:MAG: homoserine kinase, partial [Caldiserica bacterium]